MDIGEMFVGHNCNYYCDRLPCIKRQRDELRDRFQAMQAQAEIDAKAAKAQSEALDRMVWGD